MTALSASLVLIACVARQPLDPTAASPRVYETARELSAIAACSATVAEKGPCFARMRTSGGGQFYIGSPGSDAEVERFVAALEIGRTYRLPKRFRDLQSAPGRAPSR